MILVTGGAGYIGTHTCAALLEGGYRPLILDNLSNSHPEVLDRLAELTGEQIPFILGDVRDSALLERIFSEWPIQAVIHFAGLKDVGQSFDSPEEYADVNVQGTLSLLAAMAQADIRTFVFSSSATVYGRSAGLPLDEHADCYPASPYALGKRQIEEHLLRLHEGDPAWRIACLRYFNPLGAHPSGLIGEWPRGNAANLMPALVEVALGKRDGLTVWGADYATPDGTCIRDYVHVMDIAHGHISALSYLAREQGCLTVNLGTGRGYSVFEVVNAFERACGRKIPLNMGVRRFGDTAAYWADCQRAYRLLGWKASYDLDAMCAHAWRWATTMAADTA